jgi:hypothetical protein
MRREPTGNELNELMQLPEFMQRVIAGLLVRLGGSALITDADHARQCVVKSAMTKDGIMLVVDEKSNIMDAPGLRQ